MTGHVAHFGLVCMVHVFGDLRGFQIPREANIQEATKVKYTSKLV